MMRVRHKATGAVGCVHFRLDGNVFAIFERTRVDGTKFLGEECLGLEDVEFI